MSGRSSNRAMPTYVVSKAILHPKYCLHTSATPKKQGVILETSITIIKVYKSVVHGDYYIIQVIYSDGNNKISVYSHIFRLDIEVYHKPSLMMARVNSAVCANTLCNIFTTL